MFKKASFSFLAATILAALSILFPPSTPVYAEESRSEYWAVIVGVAEYQAYWLGDLDGFDANARDLSHLLSPVWGEDHVRLLTNNEATKASVLEAMNWLASKEDDNDVVLFYYAGHGIPQYLAPHDADSLDDFISAAELKGWLGALDSEKVIIIIDACNAGSFNTALSSSGRVILMSSQADENSYTAEFGGERSGLFTYYVLEALNEVKTADANNDYQVSAEEVFGYAEPKTIPPTIQWYATGQVSNIQHPALSDQHDGELALLEWYFINTEPELLSVPATIVIDNDTYSLETLELIGAPGSVHQLEISPVYTGTGIRYVFTSWNDGDTSVSRTISRGGDYTANYLTQYQLLVESAYGQPEGQGWYDAGATATISVTSIEEAATRHIFNGWNGDFTAATEMAAITMDSPKTVTAEWRTEYLLTIESAYGDPAGGGWYDEGALVTLSAPAAEGTIIRRLFTGWSGDAAADAATTSTVMDSPKVVTANWKTDYGQLYMLIGGSIAVIIAIIVTVGIRRRRAAG